MSDFDITQHEWSDKFGYLCLDEFEKHGEIQIDGFINKKDAIAIAKLFGLTAEDLE